MYIDAVVEVCLFLVWLTSRQFLGAVKLSWVWLFMDWSLTCLYPSTAARVCAPQETQAVLWESQEEGLFSVYIWPYDCAMLPLHTHSPHIEYTHQWYAPCSLLHTECTRLSTHASGTHHAPCFTYWVHTPVVRTMLPASHTECTHQWSAPRSLLHILSAHTSGTHHGGAQPTYSRFQLLVHHPPPRWMLN